MELAPKYPAILVDWTGLPKNFYSISASVAFHGRSVPIYAEVYPESKKSNRREEERFLRRLKDVLPSNCQPTVVTDAGFYTEWCDAVESLGWSFVVRVRDKTMYRERDESVWIPIRKLHEIASRKVRSLGWVWVNARAAGTLVGDRPTQTNAVSVRTNPGYFLRISESRRRRSSEFTRSECRSSKTTGT